MCILTYKLEDKLILIEFKLLWKFTVIVKGTVHTESNLPLIAISTVSSDLSYSVIVCQTIPIA